METNRQPALGTQFVSRRALHMKDAAIYVVRDVSAASVVLCGPDDRHGTLYPWTVFKAELRHISLSVRAA